MDYDENDFQGHNLQLTGEGSSKFSPVLHPYALPKFDFDDSIQGHLRFDSLVENEVFLGIPSQEDNQWIEDFSRGSSGIEFSSSAAESCSISRRNNVWSEATSSESVEMLLKSVGQEEMVPGETIIEESDAVNELGNLTKRRESNSKQDDRMEDAKDFDPALPLDQALGNFCGLNESAEVERPHVKYTSQIQEAELSAYVVSSGESDPNAVGGNCVIFLNKENLGIEQKCDDANQGEADTSVNEFLNNEKQEDISVSRIQTDKLDSSLQNVTARAGELDDQEILHKVSHICFESASGLAKVIDKGVEEHRVQGKLADIDNKILSGYGAKTCTSELDNPLCITSMVESVEEHAIETSINIFEKLSSLELKGDCDLQIGEGCSENVLKHPAQGSQCEVVVLSEATEIKQQLKDNMLHEESLIAFQVGDNFGEHVVEVSNTVAGISASLELKTCSPAEITLGRDSDIEKNKNFVGSDDKMDGGASANGSEASVLFGMDNKSSREGDGSSTNNTANLASLMEASSSAELRREKPSTENLKDINDASGVQVEENMAVDNILPPLLLGSMQMCKESLSSDQGDAHDCDQDVPFLERGNVKLPLDSSNMECEIVESLDGDERAGSLGSGEVCKENVERAYRSEVDVTIRTEPSTLDANVEDTDLASHDTCGGVPSHSSGGSTAAEVIDYNKEKSPLIVQETDSEAHEEASLSTVKDDSQVRSHSRGGATTSEVSDHNEEQKSSLTVQRADVEAHESLSTVKDDSQVVNEIASVSEVEQGAACDVDADVPHKMVDLTVLVAETRDTTTQSEQVIVANEVSQEFYKKLEVHPVFRDSAVKVGNDAEAVAFEHQKETTLEKNDEATFLKLADAVIVPKKGEVLTEAAVVSLVESCFDVGQKDHEGTEATMASEVNNCGQSEYDARGDASNDHQASFNVVPSCEYDAKGMLEGGGTSVEPHKPDCGSATITTCIELPQSEKDDQEDVKGDQEDVKGAVVENIPLSEFTVHVEGKITPTSINSRGLDTSKEERSFTFDVSPSAGLLEGEIGKGWQSVPTIQACKISAVVEGSPSTGCQMNPRITQEISRGSPQTPDGGTARAGAKATSERKTRRGSGKTGKESARMGNHVKETTPVMQRERGGKPCVPMSPSGIGQFVQFEELKPRGSVERGGARSGSVVSIPTSNLPDLNTSAPPSVLFQQPFTDLQQMQLRAQIFVYGALIQGGAPPEAFMVSAFGPSDVGRSVWEPAWRVFVERLHGQKLPAKNSETPMHSHSGSKTPEHASKQGAFQSKVLASPVGRVSSKGTSSPVVNPMMPLSSPLWNISTPSDGLQSSGMQRGPVVDYHQALSPLHPYQTPPTRNFVGHTTSWLPQAPFPSPWVASPQTSAFDISSRLPALPITETVKLTPVKESSVPDSSGAKHVSSISVAQSGGSSVFPGTSPLIDMKKLTGSPGLHSADSKARRRKRVPVTEDIGQISLPGQNQTVSVSAPVVSSHLLKQVPDSEDIGHFSMLARSQTESVSAPVVNTHFSTSVAVTTPACFVSIGNSGKFLTASSSPTSSSDRTKRGDQNAEKNILISEETFSKVEEAKLYAEDAAVHAAAAVSHCQDVWSQLDKQKNSGLVSDVEAKLASAAVAISAAASVAKAAAAAANIASNAAAQAKQMADEVLVFGGTCNSTQSNAISLPHIVNDLGKATPAFILKGGDGGNCFSSVISVAREAARRRVEAASTASKHAENLDAIVKAAELAAEAVSQAGKIVAMGDPLPLNKLIEAGPEGYWKLAQLSSEQGVKSNNVNGYQSNINNVEEVPNVSVKQSKEGPSDKDKQTPSSRAMSPLSREICRDLTEDQKAVVEGMSGSVTGGENFTGQRRRASELAKTIAVIPESEIGSRSNFVIAHDEYGNVAGTSKENNVKEGSVVEVFKDGGDFKAAWFPANILCLRDGKAFVCYTEFQSVEGSGQLKEWVPLESEGSKAPLVRIAHPMTNMQFEGTRKRSRSVTNDYAWSVGDRVDAWTQDCWREGVVTEKNSKDETTLTVLFQAEGETSVVRTWHLRPTLIWKDGLWIEWPREDLCSQGETPQKKRLKLGSSAIKGRAKDKTTKDFDIVESGDQDESRLLPLSANENLFSVGKNTRDENKPDALRTMRTGPQKEGSRVVFGVPKPGKKRKFMEVSKHYVSERSPKNNTANDSVNFRKYLMPQGSGSRGWKNNCKIDSKEKNAADSKARVLKGKPPSVPARILPRKDNLLTSTVSSPSDATTADHVVKDSIRSDENKSGQQNHLSLGSLSNTEGQAEAPILFTSLALPPDALSKMVSTPNVKSGRLNKGKLAPAGGKTAKFEAKDKSIPEVVEPRRSIRRIQPTSRLLEGLQSSLIVSKSPSVSHDKSHRSQIRGTSKGSNK